MKFIVDEAVFQQLGTVCFGVVIAKGLNNQGQKKEIAELLESSIRAVENKFANSKVKESAEIAPYRAAFTRLGINPNKFMSSVEAMASRVEKQKGFPQISPVVDLANAISLKYLLPMGAHDIDATIGDLVVRFSREGDRFAPFGQTEEEILQSGELIYCAGDKVKTRRWVWRQSEYGKVTAESKNVFFPIDGFADANCNSVMSARNELAALLQDSFHCQIQVGWVDKENREIAF